MQAQLQNQVSQLEDANKLLKEAQTAQKPDPTPPTQSQTSAIQTEETVLYKQACKLAMLALPHAAGHLTGSLSVSNDDGAGEASEHLLKDIFVFSSRLASRAMPQSLGTLCHSLTSANARSGGMIVRVLSS